MAAAAVCVLGLQAGTTLALTGVVADVPAPAGAMNANLSPAQAFTYERVFGTRMGERVSIDRVDLGDGRVVDLDLERFNVLAPGARIVAEGAGGVDDILEDVDVVLLRGTVRGQPESRVFLGLSLTGVHGYVQAMDGATPALYAVSSGAFVGGNVVEVSTPADLAVRAQGAIAGPLGQDRVGDRNGVIGQNAFCATDTIDQPFADLLADLQASSGNTPAVRGSAPCRVMNLAIDSDWRFTQRFGGNTNASAAYAMTLIAASSEIYRRDINLRIEIPFLRVWSNSNDPWNPGDAGQVLNQLRSHWRSQMSDVDRDLVHLLSGDSLGGGVAWLSTLCNVDYGYAVSGNLNGSFPMPVIDNSNQNWDLMVVSHELGHNLGSGHTHEAYNPVVDGCGNGDCSNSQDTTIMSYCHLCPGGLSNMDMRFHPRVIDRILSYLSNACNIEAGGATAASDFVTTLEAVAVEYDPIRNDATAECTNATLGTFEPVSANGGTIELTGEVTFTGDPIFRYTPAEGFFGTDTASYTIAEGGTGLVTFDVQSLREPAVPVLEDPGVRTVFYNIPAGTDRLPVFDNLLPAMVLNVPQVDFAATPGDFGGSGLTDNFGAVFEMYVDIPVSGVWTMSIESDDGSRLWYGLGDDAQALLGNDGLHGMQDRSIDLPLRAGKHPFRIEYFEAGGDAGMIFRMEGPETARQIIPASRLTTEYVCPADFTLDRSVNILDVIAFINAWQNGDPATDVVDNDGGLTIIDVIRFIELFQQGC